MSDAPRVAAATPGVLRFGVFELDASAGELRKAGRLVRLQPQPLKVLSMLASRSGQVVSREELTRAIWGDETFVDFERGLNFCIAQVRTALGDDADSSRFIQTLPRRGYRFVASVETIGAQHVASDSQAASKPATAAWTRPTDAKRSDTVVGRWPRALVIAVGLLLVVGVGLAGWQVRTRRAAPATPARVMMAVLPFNDLGGNPADDYEGLAEIRRAQALDPLSPRANIDVGWALIRTGRYDEAIAQSRRTLELEPDFVEAEACLERAYLLKGMPRQALDAARVAMARTNREDTLPAIDESDPIAALGETEAALTWLERAYDDRSVMLGMLRLDPAFTGLRNQPRFATLLERIARARVAGP